VQTCEGGHGEGTGVGELHGGADIEAGDEKRDDADAQRGALAGIGGGERVFDGAGGVAGQMEGVNNDDAETAMWVERLEECVAENEQRDYGNEEVHRDHQGQVLALDLPIAPAGTKEEPDPWPLLEVGSILPSTGAPRWLSARSRILG